MPYKTDYHLHTQYSDGGRWPEDYISPAIRAGLSEIGFSDHLTLTPEQQEWSIIPALLEEYCERILKLKRDNNDIIVRVGLEIDYFPDKEAEIEKISNNLPLDYVIGSVHYMNMDSVDTSPSYYKHKDIDLLFETYFELVARAAATGLFDIMGHPDLVRIYGARPKSNICSLYRNLAKNLKKADVAIEVNTNGYNKPLGDLYPDKDYLKIFSEEGVPVCVNSDAHKPERVGQYFDEAYSLLLRAGYTSMALFESRIRKEKELI